MTFIVGGLALVVGPLEAQEPSGIPSDMEFSVGPGTLGTEVFQQPLVNGFYDGLNNHEQLYDVHLTEAGNLVSFDFAYHLVSADPGVGGSAVVFNFYENTAGPDHPLVYPTTLLDSVTFNVPPPEPGAGWRTIDLATPIPLPKNIWLGVWIETGHLVVGGFGAGAPVIGTSHGHHGFSGPRYNYVTGPSDWWFGPIYPSLTLRMGEGIPSNHPPTCVVHLEDALAAFTQSSPGVFVVTEGETITVPFTGLDADAELLTVSSTGLPSTASLSPTSGMSPLRSIFQWTPTAAEKGSYLVEVTFTDPAGDDVSSSVAISDINLKPVCSASDQTLECTSSSGASVTLDGSATDADDITLMYHWDVSSAAVFLDDAEVATPTGVFPIGVTMATLTVTDGRGGVSTCDVLITVEDTLPPDVMCTTDVAALWSPNHTMRAVTLIVKATDACADPSAVLPITVNVSSNEPDNAVGKGDGNTTGDVNGADGFGAGVDVTSLFTYVAATEEWIGTILLRAERASAGEGRKYTIDVTALDSAANSATTSCCIVVPHDRRGPRH